MRLYQVIETTAAPVLEFALIGHANFNDPIVDGHDQAHALVDDVAGHVRVLRGQPVLRVEHEDERVERDGHRAREHHEHADGSQTTYAVGRPAHSFETGEQRHRDKNTG